MRRAQIGVSMTDDEDLQCDRCHHAEAVKVDKMIGSDIVAEIDLCAPCIRAMVDEAEQLLYTKDELSRTLAERLTEGDKAADAERAAIGHFILREAAEAEPPAREVLLTLAQRVATREYLKGI